MDPAVAAVVASGVVAVTAIIAPIITTLLADSLKWRRERKAAEVAALTIATTKVLDTLADHRSGQVREATGKTARAVYSDLLGEFYAWEMAILTSGQDVDRQRLKDLRREIEGTAYNSVYSLAPKLADEIIQITRTASTKRGWWDEPAED
jgi:glutamine synthetase adenylyltransferase